MPVLTHPAMSDRGTAARPIYMPGRRLLMSID